MDVPDTQKSVTNVLFCANDTDAVDAGEGRNMRGMQLMQDRCGTRGDCLDRWLWCVEWPSYAPRGSASGEATGVEPEDAKESGRWEEKRKRRNNNHNEEGGI